MNQRGDDDKTVIDESNQIARIVAALLRSRLIPLVHPITEKGEVVFAFPLKPLRLTKAELDKTAMVRTNAFANFVGEYFVRKHPELFEPLVLCADYKQLVRAFSHQHFGLWIEPGAIRWQFHISFLNDIFNHDLREMLKHEPATL